MAGFTLIRALSIFHITLAFFFFTSPQTLSDQSFVFILGESMRLPEASSFGKPSAANAFIAVLLAFLGLTDLTAASQSEDIAIPYWSSQAPIRVFFLFIVTGYTYFYNPQKTRTLGMVGQKSAESLHNSLTFSWAFVELLMWFWIYVSLGDEKRRLGARRANARK